MKRKLIFLVGAIFSAGVLLVILFAKPPAPVLDRAQAVTKPSPSAVPTQNPATPPGAPATAPAPGQQPSAAGSAHAASFDAMRVPTAGSGLTRPQPGSLLLPIAGVNSSQLFDTFNQKRDGGRPHEALDIPAPRGTAVVAVDDGRVVKLFNSKPGGLTVYQFDPRENFAYYYAHLDSYAPGLAEGRALKRGDLIGYVGSTGNASPAAPHLHFAIFVLAPEKRWWEGTAINPYPVLTGS